MAQVTIDYRGEPETTPTLMVADISGPADEPGIRRRGGVLYRMVGKRLLDLVVSSVALVLVTPVLSLVWFGLRLTLGRHVVLRQERIGRGGETFSLIKFRTMKGCRRESEDSCSFIGSERRLTHKSFDDPRHTRLGRMIRRFSLDELPQLLNILRGEMSLVGPRPELAAVASAEFLSHARHEVRPGLTGPFQVSGLRGTGDLDSGLHLDEAYVANLGLARDLRYLALTSGALRQGTGS